MIKIKLVIVFLLENNDIRMNLYFSSQLTEESYF